MFQYGLAISNSHGLVEQYLIVLRVDHLGTVETYQKAIVAVHFQLYGQSQRPEVGRRDARTSKAPLTWAFRRADLVWGVMTFAELVRVPSTFIKITLKSFMKPPETNHYIKVSGT